MAKINLRRFIRVAYHLLLVGQDTWCFFGWCKHPRSSLLLRLHFFLLTLLLATKLTPNLNDK